MGFQWNKLLSLHDDNEKACMCTRPEAPGCYTNRASLELRHSWDSWSAQSLCPVYSPMREEVSVREVNKLFCLYDN